MGPESYVHIEICHVFIINCFATLHLRYYIDVLKICVYQVMFTNEFHFRIANINRALQNFLVIKRKLWD